MTPFTVPNLPTDNLYKFYALSGVISTLFIFSTTVYVLFGIRNDLDEISKSNDLIELETDFLLEDIELYDKRVEKLQKSLGQYGYSTVKDDSISDRKLKLQKNISNMQNEPEYRDYLEFLYKYEKWLIPEIAQHDEVLKLQDEISKYERKLSLKRSEVLANNKIVEGKLDQLITYGLLGAFFSFFTVRMAQRGFSSWRKHVQNPIDRKIGIEVELLEIELIKKKAAIQPDEPESTDEV